MKRTLPVLFSLILATMVFLALPLSASAATGDEQGNGSASLLAGSLSTQDATVPQGEIMLRDEFSAWGLNSDPADLAIYQYETTGTAVKQHKGVSFDLSSRTLTLDNVPATNNAFWLSLSDMGDLNVKLVGTSKLCVINATNTNLNFIGDGELFLNSPFTYTDQYGWNYENEYIFQHCIDAQNCKITIAKTVTMHFDAEVEDRASIILSYETPTTFDKAFACAATPSRQLIWTHEVMENESQHVLAISKFALNPTPTPVSELSISGVVNKQYTGKAIEQDIVVKDGSDVLTKDTHYSLKYENNKDVGKATVTVSGEGLYTGSVPLTFTITKPVSKLTISGLKNKVYNAKKQTLTLTVKDGKKTLKKDTDYTLKYKNNKDVGDATVTVTGKGFYTGAVKKTFKITKADNPLKVSAKAQTAKASALKSNKKTIKGAIKVSKNQGAVTYAKVAKGSSKQLTISSKGVITVAKGKYTKGKVLKINVKVTAKGNKNYKSDYKQVTVKVTVK